MKHGNGKEKIEGREVEVEVPLKQGLKPDMGDYVTIKKGSWSRSSIKTRIETQVNGILYHGKI